MESANVALAQSHLQEGLEITILKYGLQVVSGQICTPSVLTRALNDHELGIRLRTACTK